MNVRVWGRSSLVPVSDSLLLEGVRACALASLLASW